MDDNTALNDTAVDSLYCPYLHCQLFYCPSLLSTAVLSASVVSSIQEPVPWLLFRKTFITGTGTRGARGPKHCTLLNIPHTARYVL